MTKLVIIGGEWDSSLGKESHFVNKLYLELSKYFSVTVYNGGNKKYLKSLIYYLNSFKVILFIPKINTKIKLKNIYPNSIVVIDNNHKTIKNSIKKLERTHADLMIEYDNSNSYRIIDPLRNTWYTFTNSIHILSVNLTNRIKELLSLPRFFYSLNIDITSEMNTTINNLIKSNYNIIDIFNSNKIPYKNIICCTKHNENTLVFKSGIYQCILNTTIDKYEVKLNGSGNIESEYILFHELFKHYKHINYILHSHNFYYEQSPETLYIIPHEYSIIIEITEIIERNNLQKSPFIHINLRGHGFILLCSSLDAINKSSFYKRPNEELQLL